MSLLGGVSRLFGGGGRAPTPQTAQVDDQTNAFIDEQIKDASRPTEAFVAEATRGVDTAGNAIGGGSAQSDARLGYTDNTFNDALRRQYRAKSGQNVDRLKKTIGFTGEMMKAQQTQKALANSMARKRVIAESQQRLMEAQIKAEAARAQVLNSVLGAGGMLAGAGLASYTPKPQGQPGVTTTDIQNATQAPGGASSLSYNQNYDYNPRGAG